MENFPRESEKFAKKYFEQKYNSDVNAIAELGVMDGEHALSMYKQLKPKLFYLIDAYKDEYIYPTTGEVRKEKSQKHKEHAYEKLKDIPNHYFIEKFTHEAVHVVPEQLDLIYIDALHDELSVKRDIEVWWPKVRLGGIVCGHDFHHHPVEKIVREIFPNIRFPNGETVRKINMNRYWNAEGCDWWLVKLSGDLKNTTSWMSEDENDSRYFLK